MTWHDADYSGIGCVSYAGAWRADAPHGAGVLIFEDGREHEGLFSEARPQGRGRSVWPGVGGGADSPPIALLDPTAAVSTAGWHLTLFEGDWLAGEPCGEGAGVYNNGATFAGTWVSGLPHGAGVLTAVLRLDVFSAGGTAALIALGLPAARAATTAGGALLSLHITGEWVRGVLHGEACVWQLLAGVPSVAVLNERAAADNALVAHLAGAPRVTSLSASLASDVPHLASPRPFREATPSDSFASSTSLLPLPKAAPSSLGKTPSSSTSSTWPSSSLPRSNGGTPALLLEASLRLGEPAAMSDAGIGKLVSRLPEGASLVEVYIGGFVGGLREGTGATSTNSDGAVFTGTYRTGRRNGFGTLRSVDGAVFSGKFVAGEAEGAGTRITSNGSVEMGVWSTPRKEGVPRTPGRTPR